jgi:hypothetical protein
MLFAHLFPEGVPIESLSSAVLQETDLVEMAARVKRFFEELSRKQADEAEKATARALAAKQATDGVDLTIETDGGLLQARLEDAIYAQGEIESEARTAKLAKERAELAAGRLAQSDAANVLAVDTRLTKAREMLRVSGDAVEDLTGKLAEAKEAYRTAQASVTHEADALEKEIAHALALTGWQETIAAGAAVEVPHPEKIVAAGHAVTLARQAVEQAAVVRAAKEKAAEARKHEEDAKVYRRSAESLRDAAKGTDDVLSQAVASETLSVKGGRLITVVPDRGEVFYAERSDGTRWKIAIDEAIKRIRQLGAEQTAIIAIPQAAWSELDPQNKAAIHEYAVGKSVTIITAEAANGLIRAEAFQEASP